jgi:ABC-2 type transport system ATP-binding protein
MSIAAEIGQSIEPGAPERLEIAAGVAHVNKSFPTKLSAAAWVRYLGHVPRRTVLHDVSFEVHPGELFGLLGPNGAGKTTLLKMLATLCVPDSGEIRISGLDPMEQPMAVKQRIGFCTSEERSFYFRLTARENLRFFGALVGLAGEHLRKRVEEVAALVDLSYALDRRYDGFSSGMRQRLSVARALLADPCILFFDEPTRAIDPFHAKEIRTLIRDELVTRRGKTAVLATNSLEEAWGICDTVAILREGRIVAKGAPRVLDLEFARCIRYRFTLEEASHALVQTLSEVPKVRQVTALEGSEGVEVSVELEPSKNAIDVVLRALLASGAKILSLRSEEPSPLDVFLGLTQT